MSDLEPARGLGPHGFGADPGQQQAGQVAEGELVAATGDHVEREGPLTRLYWCRLPGLERGREQSAIVRAMKPRSGAASPAETNWCT